MFPLKHGRRKHSSLSIFNNVHPIHAPHYLISSTPFLQRAREREKMKHISLQHLKSGILYRVETSCQYPLSHFFVINFPPCQVAVTPFALHSGVSAAQHEKKVFFPDGSGRNDNRFCYQQSQLYRTVLREKSVVQAQVKYIEYSDMQMLEDQRTNPNSNICTESPPKKKS